MEYDFVLDNPIVLMFNIVQEHFTNCIKLGIFYMLKPFDLSDSVSCEVWTHHVIEYWLHIEWAFICSTLFALTHSEHVMGFSADFIADINVTFCDKKHLISMFDSLENHSSFKFLSWLKDVHNTHHDVPIDLVFPTIVGIILFDSHVTIDFIHFIELEVISFDAKVINKVFK